MPDKLLILGQEWSVIFIDLIDNDPNVLGLCDPGLRTIFLKMDQNRESAVQTLWHEVFHAYNFSIPLAMKDKHHEYLVEYFSGAVVDCLRNNTSWWDTEEETSTQMLLDSMEKPQSV